MFIFFDLLDELILADDIANDPALSAAISLTDMMCDAARAGDMETSDLCLLLGNPTDAEIDAENWDSDGNWIG